MKTNEDTAADIIDDGLAELILERVSLQTESIIQSAFRQGLKLPFTVEHVASEDELLYSVEVVRNEDEPGHVRYLPSDKAWTFKPTNGSHVFVNLKDSEGNKGVTERYVLDVK